MSIKSRLSIKSRSFIYLWSQRALNKTQIFNSRNFTVFRILIYNLQTYWCFFPFSLLISPSTTLPHLTKLKPHHPIPTSHPIWPSTNFPLRNSDSTHSTSSSTKTSQTSSWPSYYPSLCYSSTTVASSKCCKDVADLSTDLYKLKTHVQYYSQCRRPESHTFC